MATYHNIFCLLLEYTQASASNKFSPLLIAFILENEL